MQNKVQSVYKDNLCTLKMNLGSPDLRMRQKRVRSVLEALRLIL